ncbi:hypothetical protein BUALT_Bualt09G0015200 [Buddleja alternifolia]|uniref:Protein CMSS1 n=1 Tax=Buddleja alternifolia TaxID=168488 RepID=A0AAV6X7P7_9LAMI|nr:hypothetical protein BUALT_Bualt09G0015200 [Buddleja alternifolia]
MTSSATATAGAASKKQQQQLRRPKKSISKKTKNKIKNPSNHKIKSNEKKNAATKTATGTGKKENDVVVVVEWATASQQLTYFLNQYQSANRLQLSSLELHSLKETCIVELCQGPAKDITGQLGEHLKIVFGSSWREVLGGKDLQKGQVEPGSPAVLVISSSALRSLELLRELRSLTKECHAAKLFSKHMKIEEQVSMLKNRVNIGCGTPSRIKKLIDMEALGLSRLAVIVLDMHTDVKGYSLFTLLQVSNQDFATLEQALEKSFVKKRTSKLSCKGKGVCE